MKLYHASKDIFKNIEVFKPKVPSYVMKDENTTVERICVAPTIKDCLNGLCYLTNMANRLFIDSESNELVEGYHSLKIYEFDIEEKDIYKPNKTQVPDSNKTNELWLLNQTKPLNSYLITIDDYELLANENIISNLEFKLDTIENYCKYAIVKVREEELENDITSTFNEITVPVSKLEPKTYMLDIKEFPLQKHIYKKTLSKYYCWANIDIYFKN